QGSLKIQIAGLSQGYDQTVELAGEPDEGSTVLCFGRGRLVAVETINRPGDHMAARRLLTSQVPLSPEEAARVGFQLLSMTQ
ncbi:MAG: pyridine nucleotide-disulfide oxidoreductase, partial [Frankiales bacterium]|nr:pyridine nucleotide-disulfide oxidoreductase [Frankiales bacterium]